MNFPIFDVSGATTERPETLGTKEKFWLMPSQGMDLPIVPHMFKIGRPHTGENWAEKVAFEILSSAKMPCARYEFAVHDGDAGVISSDFCSFNAQFVPANVLLETAVRGYDRLLRFRQRKYQLSTSLNLFRARPIGQPKWCAAEHVHLSAADIFVGYLVFDVLIGNTDRHHENWGVVVTYEDRDSTYALAPTFDHASSLGRNESDESRLRRLNSRDKRDTVEAYAKRARSAFYATANAPRTMLLSELLTELILLAPAATEYWATVFSGISPKVYEDIFSRIDATLISKEAAQFALRMLDANTRTIRKTVLGEQ